MKLTEFLKTIINKPRTATADLRVGDNLTEHRKIEALLTTHVQNIYVMCQTRVILSVQIVKLQVLFLVRFTS